MWSRNHYKQQNLSSTPSEEVKHLWKRSGMLPYEEHTFPDCLSDTKISNY